MKKASVSVIRWLCDGVCRSAPVKLIERAEILVSRALRVNTSLQEKCDHAIKDSTMA
jgi:hypothetical protein